MRYLINVVAEIVFWGAGEYVVVTLAHLFALEFAPNEGEYVSWMVASVAAVPLYLIVRTRLRIRRGNWRLLG